MGRSLKSRVVQILVAGVGILGVHAADALAQFDVGVADDDAWVYEHSGDPGADPVIRLWGHDGLDLNPTGYPGTPASRSYWSYGFLSWDLRDVPSGYEWAGATITLSVLPDSAYDPDRHDVYLRILTGSFQEETFVYGIGPEPVAGDDNRLAGDDTQVNNPVGGFITFEIPRNVPRSILREWSRTGRMNLAITTDADYAADASLLRIASGENALYEGPRLILR